PELVDAPQVSGGRSYAETVLRPKPRIADVDPPDREFAARPFPNGGDDRGGRPGRRQRDFNGGLGQALGKEVDEADVLTAGELVDLVDCHPQLEAPGPAASEKEIVRRRRCSLRRLLRGDRECRHEDSERCREGSHLFASRAKYSA